MSDQQAKQPDDAVTVPLGAAQPTVPLGAALPTVPLDAALPTVPLGVLQQTVQLHTDARTEQVSDPAPTATEATGASVTVAVTRPWTPTSVLEPVPAADTRPAAEIPRPGPGEYLRFGPGVPAAAPAERSRAAATWRGEALPEEPGRRRRAWTRWILPFLVLLAVLAVLLWQRVGDPIAVTGLTVHTEVATVSCGETATVTGVLRTNGAAGTITYQWKRSDGTVSDQLRQQVAKGAKQVDVVLLWQFSGQGDLRPTATLDILSPGSAHASTTFGYACD